MKLGREDYWGEGVAILLDPPKDYQVIAFGLMSAYPDSFFAFLCPDSSSVKRGSEIKGVKYAEGDLNSFGIVEKAKVKATRKQDGKYQFKVIMGRDTHFDFIITPFDGGTHQGNPLRWVNCHRGERL